ncbi:hypothetical protein [Pontimonas sp.]|uniref:hypothetical protein n=1 Tax=Pontimonas sp. TaxID=2304492 RepID=UPI0028707426|nr:hypothetical protein [Pontimonas sp.]MDR9396395.1 hypothetical protein [Pontimonas sp.]
MSERTPAGRSRFLAHRVVRGVLWSIAGLLVLALAVGAYVAWPILFPGPSGLSGQQPVSGFPHSVEATGEDGRTRTLSVAGYDGADVDLSAVQPGDRVVVSGAGFDPNQGVYVAVCAIPDDPTMRPGPCLGGVPGAEVTDSEIAEDVGEEVVTEGERAPQWAAANWINDDWAWKLFGARGFDDRELGTFTAYIEVPAAADEYVDCRREECGLFTRNDHTAIDNRMQDLYLPVSFPR